VPELVGKKSLLGLSDTSPISFITNIPLAIRVLFCQIGIYYEKADWFHLQMKKQKYNDEEERFRDYQPKNNGNNFSATRSTIALLRAA
jgi:hypothetical protein